MLLGLYMNLVSCTVGIIFLFAKATQPWPRISKVLVGISALTLFCFGIYEIWLEVVSISL